MISLRNVQYEILKKGKMYVVKIFTIWQLTLTFTAKINHVRHQVPIIRSLQGHCL